MDQITRTWVVTNRPAGGSGAAGILDRLIGGAMMAALVIIALPVVMLVVLLGLGLLAIILIAGGLTALWGRVREMWPRHDGRSNVRVIRRE